MRQHKPYAMNNPARFHSWIALACLGLLSVSPSVGQAPLLTDPTWNCSQIWLLQPGQTLVGAASGSEQPLCFALPVDTPQRMYVGVALVGDAESQPTMHWMGSARDVAPELHTRIIQHAPSEWRLDVLHPQTLILQALPPRSADGQESIVAVAAEAVPFSATELCQEESDGEIDPILFADASEVCQE